MRGANTKDYNLRALGSILTVLVMAVIMTALMSTASFAGERDRVPDIDPSQSGSLTVRMIKGSECISGAGIEIIQTAELATAGGAAVYTSVSDFDSLDIDYEGMKASDSLTAAARLDKAADKHGISGVRKTTDNKGEVLFTGLKPGIYLVRQFSRTGTADKYDLIRPYLVTVPEVVRSDTGNTWKYDVLSLPKPGITSDPGVVEQDPPVKKIVTGNPSQDGTFTFRLTAEDITEPMPSGSRGGVKEVTIRGAGTYEFGLWKYTEAGIYRYRITEVNTGEKGYIYDSTEYTLTDTVSYREGKLVLDSVITDDEGSEVSSIIFNNRYSFIEIIKTGDANLLLLWIAMLAAALVWAVRIVIRRRLDD